MKKYLIQTGPGIGDMIQFFSMARAIKEQEPDARVDFLMRGTKKLYELDLQLLECQHYADHIYWYASNTPLHNIKLIIQLYRVGYDYGFVRVETVTGSKSLWVYRIMRLVNCKTIVGTGYQSVDILVTEPKVCHYLESNALLLQAVGIKPRLNAISLDTQKLDQQWMKSFAVIPKIRMIGLSTGTNPMEWKEKGKITIYDVKSWPYDRWLKLAVRLGNRGFMVILIGGIKERNEMKTQNINIPNNNFILNTIGYTSIKQSLAIISQCSLMVGAEGGMMHSASALGIPTLTIIGGSDKLRWNPGGADNPTIDLNIPCAPCFATRRAAFCKKHRCLEDITVDMVEEKICKLMLL